MWAIWKFHFSWNISILLITDSASFLTIGLISITTAPRGNISKIVCDIWYFWKNFIYLVFITSSWYRNNNSLVGMSNSTTSPTSKALNDLLSQQQQQQVIVSILFSTPCLNNFFILTATTHFFFIGHFSSAATIEPIAFKRKRRFFQTWWISAKSKNLTKSRTICRWIASDPKQVTKWI